MLLVAAARPCMHVKIAILPTKKFGGHSTLHAIFLPSAFLIFHRQYRMIEPPISVKHTIHSIVGLDSSQ